MNHKGKILVVDDDRLVLATLTHGLAQAGYEVIDADNGDDAILLARQHRPDLALLDIRMEGKSGFDVAAYLREYCQIPFMFLSAFSDEATVKKVKELGALTSLVKPLDIQQIVSAVDTVFSKRVTRQAATVAAPEATAPAKQSEKQADTTDPLTQSVAVAMGIVMHRHSLTRVKALDKLSNQAQQEGCDLEVLCDRLLTAQEIMAGLGSL